MEEDQLKLLCFFPDFISIEYNENDFLSSKTKILSVQVKPFDFLQVIVSEIGYIFDPSLKI
jgi:hypothetical protein